MQDEQDKREEQEAETEDASVPAVGADVNGEEGYDLEIKPDPDATDGTLEENGQEVEVLGTPAVGADVDSNVELDDTTYELDINPDPEATDGVIDEDKEAIEVLGVPSVGADVDSNIEAGDAYEVDLDEIDGVPGENEEE